MIENKRLFERKLDVMSEESIKGSTNQIKELVYLHMEGIGEGEPFIYNGSMHIKRNGRPYKQIVENNEIKFEEL